MTLGTRSGIRKRETVLIADDEADVRWLVHTAIDSPLYQLIEASDGQEALNMIRERRPALVLLDINMPNHSGLNVLTAIRADPELKDMQVIILTSSEDHNDIEAGMIAGADSFVAKPFSQADLLAHVTEAIEQRVAS